MDSAHIDSTVMGQQYESAESQPELQGEPVKGLGLSGDLWGNRAYLLSALDDFLITFGFTYWNTLEIPGVPPNVNDLIDQIKQHWAVYHKVKKNETGNAKMFCKRSGLGKIEGSAFTIIEWFCPHRRVDPDGYRAGPRIKSALDGMKEYGAIGNDGWSTFGDGFMDLFWVDKKNPRVELTFYVRGKND